MTDPVAPCPRGEPFDPRFEEAIEAFLEQYRRGEIPSVTEYAEKHPDLAARIREYFPGLILLERLQQGTIPTAGNSSLGPAAEALPAARPERLGEFRVIREIGRGGMGVVYEAVQDTLERRVALKVLPFHSLLDASSLERFHREARSAAKLDCPGIVPVFGIGEERGIHYFAMQFVAGQSLDRIVREVRRIRDSGNVVTSAGLAADSTTGLALGLLSGRFGRREAREVLAGPASQVGASKQPEPSDAGETIPLFDPGGFSPQEYHRCVANLGRQAARALSFAHQRGVLHRDIKPSNLILDCDGKTWITDFGLAKDIGESSLTQSGQLVGTLRYMAPERFGGASDARSDVYGLGLTLYELLALRPAFAVEDRALLMREIIDEEPPSLRRIAPWVPQDLATIVSNAIEKRPEDRYPHADRLAEDLEAFLRGERVRTSSFRIRRVVRRYRRYALVGLVVAAAAVLAVVVSGLLGTPGVARGPNDLVVRDFDGDGLPDVVTTNFRSGNISFVRRRGRGVPKVSLYEVGPQPLSLCAADFDGRGGLDLCISSFEARNVVVLLNDGEGFGGGRKEITIDGGVYGLVAADLDGDGEADLAIADGEEAVWIVCNLGAGEFDKPKEVLVGPKPTFLSAADCDADGRTDLIVSHFHGRKISLLKNEGALAFGASTVLPAGAFEPFKVAAVDLDDDGRVDIASVDGSRSSVLVLVNEGGGVFGPVREYPVGDTVQDIEAADLDRDGHVDLIAVGGDARYVAVLKGRSDGTFEAARELVGGDAPTAVECVDWNEDGQLDLVTCNFRSHDLTVLLNLGEEGLAFAEGVRWSLSP